MPHGWLNNNNSSSSNNNSSSSHNKSQARIRVLSTLSTPRSVAALLVPPTAASTSTELVVTARCCRPSPASAPSLADLLRVHRQPHPR